MILGNLDPKSYMISRSGVSFVRSTGFEKNIFSKICFCEYFCNNIFIIYNHFLRGGHYLILHVFALCSCRVASVAYCGCVVRLLLGSGANVPQLVWTIGCAMKQVNGAAQSKYLEPQPNNQMLVQPNNQMIVHQSSHFIAHINSSVSFTAARHKEASELQLLAIYCQGHFSPSGSILCFMNCSSNVVIKKM